MRIKNVKGANKIIEAGTYYIKNPEIYKGNWHKLFNNNNPINIEIGMGKGDFIIESAQKYPNINFIGIERYDSIIVRAIQKSNDLDLNNLKLLKIDATNIDNIFINEVDTIYLNFSDPWPKDRHAKRRLTNPIFLKKYNTISQNNPHIIMKTDNIDLFNYSLETLKEEGYKINYLTHDLHQEKNTSSNILTEYEKKFIKLGKKINKLDATKLENSK